MIGKSSSNTDETQNSEFPMSVPAIGTKVFYMRIAQQSFPAGSLSFSLPLQECKVMLVITSSEWEKAKV